MPVDSSFPTMVVKCFNQVVSISRGSYTYCSFYCVCFISLLLLFFCFILLLFDVVLRTL